MNEYHNFDLELFPTEEQKQTLLRIAEACRCVYNKALASYREQFEKNNTVRFKHLDFVALMPSWAAENEGLARVPPETSIQILKDLELNIEHFFTGGRPFPAMRRKTHCEHRVQYLNPLRIFLDQRCNRIWFPEVWWISYQCKEPQILGLIQSATVYSQSPRVDQWFVGLQAEEYPHPGPILNVDIG